MELGVRINLLLYFVVFVAMLFLNIVIPYTADDFTYGYASNGILMSIKFAWLQYHIWDGRLITSIITSYLLQRGGEIIFFNIINALVFVVFLFEVVCISSSLYIKNKWLYILICLGVISTVFVDFGEVILWKTASIQYLWGVVLYIYIFNKYLFEDSSCSVKVKINILDCFIFFISAFWLQNINIIFISLILFIIWRDKTNFNYVAYLAVYIVGSIISLIAPGNFYRKKFVYEFQTSHQDYDLFYKITHFHHDFVINSGGFIIVYALLFCLVYFVLNNEKQILKKSNLFFMFGFVINYMMILFPAGVWTTRTWFAGNVFMLIASLIIFNHVIQKNKVKYSVIILAILGGCIFVYKYLYAYEFYSDRMKQTSSFILFLKQSGCDDNKITKAGDLYDLSIINDSWLFSFTTNYQNKHLCGYINNEYYANPH